MVRWSSAIRTTTAEHPTPFASDEVDNLILGEYATLFGRAPPVTCALDGHLFVG